MAQSSKLVEEMVAQFLSRLPSKALMRFKCIRKSWYNLINSPSFVAQNLFNSMNNKFTSSTCIIAKHTVLKDSSITDRNEISTILGDGHYDKKQILLSSLTLCDNLDGDDQELYCIIEDDLIVPFPLCRNSYNFYIAGHCDGIICLSSFLCNDRDIALCNPSIKEFNHLPKSCIHLPPKDEDDYVHECNVGFGYDSKAKVYKVVRIVDFSSSHPPRAEVYTLGADCWIEIKAFVLGTISSPRSLHMHFKGIYYWSGFSYITRELQYVLFAFDMSDELFYLIYLPEAAFGIYCNLAVWKESLLLITHREEAPKCFDLWLNEDSDFLKGSWTKYFTIKPIEVDIPLVFWKSNEILMVNVDRRIVSYNLDTQTLKCLPIHGAEDPLCIYAINYVNSIISVKRNNKLECVETYI
ncbi:F-box protein CPR1-like isoform X1 [Rosa rugosa]|uniref:F-box protein CPR1-like isoform X1 n=1 Tax=Rosa rugosa TaxID=74645 RepID=UPI002B406C88|nr:F-box protein CPR1-like isoform X1 [Rosa rugosa]